MPNLAMVLKRLHMKALLLWSVFFLSVSVSAQPGRSYVRHGVERKVEQQMDSTYRKKGQKAVRDVTYDNDTRYKNPNNKMQATVTYLDSTFKKDRVKGIMSTTLIFGKQGEAYVTRDEEKGKDIQWFIFNYADKANYIVQPEHRTAMKMPLINFKRMMEKTAEREAERTAADGGPTLQATDEYGSINGYRCRKFVQAGQRGTSTDLWVSNAIRLDLSGNYMMGARLDAYRFPDNPQYKDLAKGFIVRSVYYDDRGKVKYTRTLSAFNKGKADEKYFDLSGYKITDVLSGL